MSGDVRFRYFVHRHWPFILLTFFVVWVAFFIGVTLVVQSRRDLTNESSTVPWEEHPATRDDSKLLLSARRSASARLRFIRCNARKDYVDVVLPIIHEFVPSAVVHESTYHRLPDIIWDFHSDDEMFFKRLRPGTFINSIPGLRPLGIKANLTSIVANATRDYGEKGFEYYPPTFSLPEDISTFEAARLRAPDDVWICKPQLGYSSTGIFLLYPGQPAPKGSVVVQRYVSRPLLYRGYKFDLRLFLLVTSVDPLVVYHFPLGIPRIATVKYRDDRYDAHGEVQWDADMINKKYVYPTLNKCLHLTDPNVQKWSCGATSAVLESFPSDTDALALSFASTYGVDVTAPLRQAFEIGLRVVLSAVRTDPSILAKVKALASEARGIKSFQLIGVDAILEASGDQPEASSITPRLLEVNLNPNLGADERHPFSPRLLRSLFRLVGLSPRSSPLLETAWNRTVHDFCTLRAESHTLGGNSMLYSIRADSNGEDSMERDGKSVVASVERGDPWMGARRLAGVDNIDFLSERVSLSTSSKWDAVVGNFQSPPLPRPMPGYGRCPLVSLHSLRSAFFDYHYRGDFRLLHPTPASLDRYHHLVSNMSAHDSLLHDWIRYNGFWEASMY
eukprot:Rmarinus@m.8068